MRIYQFCNTNHHYSSVMIVNFLKILEGFFEWECLAHNSVSYTNWVTKAKLIDSMSHKSMLPLQCNQSFLWCFQHFLFTFIIHVIGFGVEFQQLRVRDLEPSFNKLRVREFFFLYFLEQRLKFKPTILSASDSSFWNCSSSASHGGSSVSPERLENCQM